MPDSADDQRTAEKNRPALDRDAREWLMQLLDVPAPSGFEEPAAELWGERARTLGLDVSSDRIGTTFARSGGEGPRIALVGHVDEIGLIVTRVDDQGYLRCASIGGWDVAVLVGQRLRVLGTPAGGPVVGAVSRTAVHLLDADQRGKVPKVTELWVDIGAASREEAESMVRVGDPAVLDVAPVAIGPDGAHRLMSRSLDDRIGAFVVLEAARECASRGVAADVVAVASVGEEIGMGGAMAAAAGLEPDVAIAVDVTSPGDTPNGQEFGDLHLRRGPILSRGSSLANRVVDGLVAAAEAHDIPYQLRAKGRRTATDADQLVKAGPGVATGLVSIPARYLHSPVEQCDERDVQTSIDLLVAYVEKVAKDT